MPGSSLGMTEEGLPPPLLKPAPHPRPPQLAARAVALARRDRFDAGAHFIEVRLARTALARLRRRIVVEALLARRGEGRVALAARCRAARRLELVPRRDAHLVEHGLVRPRQRV